jgi:hypothetical protein
MKNAVRHVDGSSSDSAQNCRLRNCAEHFTAYCRRGEVMPYRNMATICGTAHFAFGQRWGIPYIYVLFYGVTVAQSFRTPDILN